MSLGEWSIRTARVALRILLITLSIYTVALIILTNPTAQRYALYAHKVRSPSWWHDINTPEQFGFATKQVTPFNLTTPDGEIIYAWHVLPITLYAENRAALLHRANSGLTGTIVENITATKGFGFLRNDPNARLVINFHGNAGDIVQGWRTETYRALYAVNTSNIHILAIDYRGFGLSTGYPTEQGLIIDGIAAVNWALEIAKVPADRIVIVGQSLGTGVTAGVVEHFAKDHVDFAGVVLVAGFTDLPNLLTDYKIAGYIPILGPLKRFPVLQNVFKKFVVDKWPSKTRLVNFIRFSKFANLFLIHAFDDHEISWHHSNELFKATTNELCKGDGEQCISTVTLLNDGSVIETRILGESTRKKGKSVSIELSNYGGHNQIMTNAPVTLAIREAFCGVDERQGAPGMTRDSYWQKVLKWTGTGRPGS